MAKFIWKVLLFFAVMTVIDFVSDFGFKYLRKHAKSGDTYKNYYISEKCSDDILILGSSRAARHYDPYVLQDSLSMTCYNCGEPGCGIITAYARYRMIASRHNPKLVIYEVSPSYDYLKTDDYSKYLGVLRQCVDNPSVKKIFLDLGDELEELRLVSHMYKNNSFIVQNIKDNLIKIDGNNGYQPLHGTLSSNAKFRAKNKVETNDALMIDSLKLSYMEQLIVESRQSGTSICFLVSPKFITSEMAIQQEDEYKPIMDLCSFYHIPFINHTYIDGISDNRQFFQDYLHMNSKGTTEYSKVLCCEIAEL